MVPQRFNIAILWFYNDRAYFLRKETNANKAYPIQKNDYYACKDIILKEIKGQVIIGGTILEINITKYTLKIN